MNKLISILASTVIAVSAMMTTSGTIKTSADQGNKITQEELKTLFGDGDITVSLSIQ